MKEHRLAAAAVLVLAFGLRVGAIAPKPALEHDDAMTYVASSGRETSEWASLQGRWVEAARWKALVSPLPGLRIGEIARHLEDSRIVHPPLYFWLLHAWSLAFGTGIAAGPALNVLIACLTLVVLYRLGFVLLGSQRGALAAVALWALSPGSIGVSVLVRPYELLQLLGCLLALGVARIRTEGRGAGLVFAASAAGMLTHYEFAFCVVAAAAALVMPARAPIRGAGRGLAALTIGAVSTLLVNPGFLLPFVAQAGATRAMWGRISERLQSPDLPTLRLFDLSFLAPPWGEPWSAPLGVAYVLLLALLLVGALRAVRSSRAEGFRPAGPLLAATFFASVYFGHGVAWVLGLVPLHASGSRYLSPAYPFLALLLVAASRGLDLRAGHAVLSLLAGLELGSAGLLLHGLAQQRQWAVPDALTTAECVLVDNTGTGVLPRIVAVLPDSTLVFAEMQAALLLRPGPWRGDLARCRRSAWASVDSFFDANDPERTRALGALIEKEASLEEHRSYPLVGADVSRVGRRPLAGS